MTVTREEQRKQREECLAAYKASGQSVKVWCEANGVSCSWMWRKLREEKTLEANNYPGQTAWLRATVTDADTGGIGLVVRIGRATVEVRPGFDLESFERVVRLLSAIC